MVRERGSSVTPSRVVELINREVAEKSMLAVSKATGLGLAAIGRYMKGIGEPTTATLKKIAYCLGVSVAWLRGGEVGPLERLLEGLRIAGVDSAVYNKTIAEKTGKELDYWGRLIGCIEEDNQSVIGTMCGVFGINKTWVVTGYKPTNLPEGEIIGTIKADPHAIAEGANKLVTIQDMVRDYYGDEASKMLAPFNKLEIIEKRSILREINKLLQTTGRAVCELESPDEVVRMMEEFVPKEIAFISADSAKKESK